MKKSVFDVIPTFTVCAPIADARTKPPKKSPRKPPIIRATIGSPSFMIKIRDRAHLIMGDAPRQVEKNPVEKSRKNEASLPEMPAREMNKRVGLSLVIISPSLWKRTTNSYPETAVTL